LARGIVPMDRQARGAGPPPAAGQELAALTEVVSAALKQKQKVRT
jgi:hypothetical protein